MTQVKDLADKLGGEEFSGYVRIYVVSLLWHSRRQARSFYVVANSPMEAEEIALCSRPCSDWVLASRTPGMSARYLRADEIQALLEKR